VVSQDSHMKSIVISVDHLVQYTYVYLLWKWCLHCQKKTVHF